MQLFHLDSHYINFFLLEEVLLLSKKQINTFRRLAKVGYLEAMQYSPFIKKLMAYYAVLSMGRISIDHQVINPEFVGTFSANTNTLYLAFSNATFSSGNTYLDSETIRHETIHGALSNLFQVPEHITGQEETLKHFYQLILRIKKIYRTLSLPFSLADPHSAQATWQAYEKVIQKELNALASQSNITLMWQYRIVVPMVFWGETYSEVARKAWAGKRDEVKFPKPFDYNRIPNKKIQVTKVRIQHVRKVPSLDGGELIDLFGLELIPETNEQAADYFKLGVYMLQQDIISYTEEYRKFPLHEAIAMIYEKFSLPLIQALFPNTHTMLTKSVNERFYKDVITYKKDWIEPILDASGTEEKKPGQTRANAALSSSSSSTLNSNTPALSSSPAAFFFIIKFHIFFQFQQSSASFWLKRISISFSENRRYRSDNSYSLIKGAPFSMFFNLVMHNIRRKINFSRPGDSTIFQVNLIKKMGIFKFRKYTSFLAQNVIFQFNNTIDSIIKFYFKLIS